MNRFFRSALFPLVIIAALVWLALQTLGGSSSNTQKVTYSQVYGDILQCRTETHPGCAIQEVVFNPNKIQLQVKYANGKKGSVHYPSEQVVPDLQQAMQKHGILYDSKGTGSSPWWSILTSLLPFVLLFGFWIFLMNQVQGGGSKVMSFGKSRAKRMTPDSPKIGFKDVAGVEEAVEELQEIKEFLENPKKFQALGARIPKGVLLYGPPGTGKTLLARVVDAPLRPVRVLDLELDLVRVEHDLLDRAARMRVGAALQDVPVDLRVGDLLGLAAAAPEGLQRQPDERRDDDEGEERAAEESIH